MEVRLKEAIIKYLKNEWTEDEKAELKKIRYELASEMVPLALGSSSTPLPLGAIEEYIKVIAEDPESERCKTGKDYISQLFKSSKRSLLVDTTKISEIERMAKLHYLNKYFFCVSAKVENDCLKYGKSTSDMPYVTFSEKGVQIRKKLKKEDIVNLVPEPRIIHVSFYPHSPIVHLGTIKITTSSVDDAVVRNELLDRIKQCYIKEIETEAKSLSLDYEISFIEGEADSDGIKLRKYTPRIESALDKILSESKK